MQLLFNRLKIRTVMKNPILFFHEQIKEIFKAVIKVFCDERNNFVRSKET
jgi:hypothetical protein